MKQEQIRKDSIGMLREAESKGKEMKEREWSILTEVGDREVKKRRRKELSTCFVQRFHGTKFVKCLLELQREQTVFHVVYCVASTWRSFLRGVIFDLV